jgi:hypothetical protein
MRAARNPFTVVLLAAALAGCSTQVGGTGTAGAVTAAPITTTTTAAAAGTGITAGSLSSALRVQARDLRLVRVGASELALQFEFANNGDHPITPDTLGIDQIERILILVDLPRSIAYETLTRVGNDGRISESNGDQVPPGGQPR